MHEERRCLVNNSSQLTGRSKQMCLAQFEGASKDIYAI